MPSTHTLAELAEAVQGKLLDPVHSEVLIDSAAGLLEATAQSITYVESPRLLSQAVASPCAAILVPEGVQCPERPAIAVRKPRLAFAKLLRLFHPPLRPTAGRHAASMVSPGAEIHPTASVGPYVIVEDGARIGEDAQLMAHVRVGRRATVGARTLLYPHVTVGCGAAIGGDCILHAHTRVAEGATLGAGVEIGARAVIEASATVAEGTKSDNHVFVGRGARVGRACILVWGTTLGEGCCLGNGVVMAAEACVDKGAVVDDLCVVGGKSVVTEGLAGGSTVSGIPARPHKDELRSHAQLNRLQGTSERLQALERQLP